MTVTPPPPALQGGSALPAALRARVEAAVTAVPVDFGGGSSLLKALVLVDLVVAEGLERVVEIGVWRGRSLLPLAAAMDHLDRGEAVGIDPYSSAAAVQTDEREIRDALAGWAVDTDWEAVHDEVLARVERLGLGRRCTLLRMTSEAAADRFLPGSIDLLHVDGNHDRDAVARDLRLYVPALRPGGLLVLDDISWLSVREAGADVRARWQPVLELMDPHGRMGAEPNDFGVYRRPVEGT